MEEGSEETKSAGRFEEEWEQFRSEVLSVAPPFLVKDMRLGFYAGAYCLILAMADAGRTGNKAGADAVISEVLAWYRNGRLAATMPQPAAAPADRAGLSSEQSRHSCRTQRQSGARSFRGDGVG